MLSPMASHPLQGQPLNDTSQALMARAALLPGNAPQFRDNVAVRRQTILDAESIYGPQPADWAALQTEVSIREMHIELPGRMLRARLYEPSSTLRAASPAGDTLVVYFHGGGWVIGDLDSSHYGAGFMARELGAPVLSVEYRKAPECPYPLPVHDAIESFDWARVWMPAGNLGLKRLALCGDSAGAHLAGLVMHARTAQVAAALLWYPVADAPQDSPSYTERGSGPGLTSDSMRWFWSVFMAGQEASQASLLDQSWPQSPPPTVITAAWHDPLFDEAVRYADALQAAGGSVDFCPALDMAHGYLRQCWRNPAAADHVKHAIAALKKTLAPLG
jgi:acetyl esterase